MLEEVTCGDCGVVYAMPTAKLNNLKKSGNAFYCPNGHRRHYIVGPSEEEKTIERLRGQLRDSWEQHGDILGELREVKERSCHCVICGYKVARVNASQVTIDLRMREHLEQQHGARRSFRALSEKASAGNA